MVDVSLILYGENMNIKTEDGISSVGKEASNFRSSGWLPVVKVKNEIPAEDGSSETGNLADVFETKTPQTRRVKNERVVNSSLEEHILSHASNSSAEESNILIKKEEDIDADDEVFQTIIESKYRASPEDGEQPSQSTTLYDQVNGSSEWGLCEEDCSVSSPAAAENDHISDSQKSKRSSILARILVGSEDSQSHPTPQKVEKQFACRYCSAKFPHSIHLKSHLKIHDNEKPFACKLCPARFCETSTLRRHQLIHTGEKRFACTYCPKKFSHNSTLKSHLTIHTGLRMFTCTYCSAKFSQSSNLKTHLRIHTNERPYTCSYCPATFIRKDDLKGHLSTHTGEKPYECSYCPARFSRSCHFNTHMKIHTNERPYPCTYCPAKFTQSGTLKRHLTTHTGEKPFSCLLCSAKFTRSSHLTSHMKVHKAKM